MKPVELPIPPSVNSIWRTVRVRSAARVTLSKQYRSWLDIAILTLRTQMAKVEPADYPVAVRVTIVRGAGWRKGRDADNCMKVIADALVKSGRIRDDDEDHVTEFTIRFGPTAVTACVLVAVEPMGAAA